MKSIFVLVLLFAVASAALDQNYVQSFNNSGSSISLKSMDISVFSGTLSSQELSLLNQNCVLNHGCSFNKSSNIIILSEELTPQEGYYDFNADYSLPFITYTVKINSLPNDRFSSDLTSMMGLAPGNYQPTDFNKDNSGTAKFLGKLNANFSYEVIMPAQIDQASAGAINGTIVGNVVTFNLLDVMNQKGPITITAHELNLTYIIIVIAIIVIVAIAISFRKETKKVKKPQKTEEASDEPKKKKKK